MTKCNGCGVLVDGSLQYCPLCRRKFDVSSDNRVNEWYPQYETVSQNSKKNESGASITKTTLFTAIVICCDLTLLNAFVLTERLWCHSFIIPVAYVVFTIIHTFCSRTHLGLKILFQVIAVTGLLLAVDIQSGFTRWSLNYAFPSLIIAATHAMIIITSVNKSHFYGFIEFVVALILLSLLPVHLYIYGVSNIFWPAILAEVNSILTMAGLFIFSANDFINEIKRRFHF